GVCLRAHRFTLDDDHDPCREQRTCLPVAVVLHTGGQVRRRYATMWPNKRYSGRDLLVSLGISLLLGSLAWSLLSKYIRHTDPPEVQAAAAALRAGDLRKAIAGVDRL